MKVTNWRRKLIASLVAGGTLAPGIGYALDIPLGDPSFENYVVTPFAGINTGTGYAYAQNPSGAYRPTSPWVDDLDSPPGFAQDAGSSNWIYNSAYAEGGSLTNRRPAPRTGNQAMHGLDGNYNAQKLVNVFEADKTYTFSLWAQNDVETGAANGFGLYIFDGNVPFSAANALKGQLYTISALSQRTAAMTAAQSQANWGKLTVQATVFAGDAAVGHPIGVGFRGFRDSAVDDATLSVDPAINSLMYLEVNTTNGQVRVRNQTGATVNIDYYEIKSASGALNSTTWSSLQDQNQPGFPTGNGSGNGWEEAGGSSSTVLSESYLTGNSGVTSNAIVGLGAAYRTGFTHDITFRYGALLNTAPAAQGDYNNDGIVNTADYVLWRKGGTLQNDPTPGVQPADYTFWRAHFGNTGGGASGTSTLFRGPVFYVTSFSGLGSGSSVPEPTGVVLCGIGIATLAVGSRRRTTSS
jgi:hypothetical protein